MYSTSPFESLKEDRIKQWSFEAKQGKQDTSPLALDPVTVTDGGEQDGKRGEETRLVNCAGKRQW